jgi:SAM-dependent methyltransferase
VARVTSPYRYDGLAEWYETNVSSFTASALRELLGPGQGRCLDLGWRPGVHIAALTEMGWRVVGLDLSPDQLRLARERVGALADDLVLGNAAELPFADASFEAVVSAFVHTDVDDFSAVAREVQRVLVPGGRFVYVGTHPCFIGPFAERSADDRSRRLHKGYRDAGWHNEGPRIRTTGLRHRVGVRHVPLAELVNAIVATGLLLERFAEGGGDDEFPDWLALAALNPRAVSQSDVSS